MSDIISSLPIKTELPGDVQVKIVDSLNPSQQLTVNLDGSINVISSATDLDIRDLSHTQDSVKIGDGTDFLAINVDGSINAIVSATDLDIRDLSAATDSVSAFLKDGAGNALTSTLVGSKQALDVRVAEGINVEVDLNYVDDSVTSYQGGTWTIDSITNAVTVQATDLDIRDLAFATDKVDVSGSAVSISGTVDVSATNLDIRDLSHTQDSVKIGDGTDFLAINNDGSINVVVQASGVQIAVQDFNTATVNGNASSTHTYTATANFYFTQVEASASDRLKIEVRVNGVTKAVQFNSSSNTNMSITFSEPLMITSGQTIQVIRTNRASQQDVYSTIIGYN